MGNPLKPAFAFGFLPCALALVAASLLVSRAQVVIDNFDQNQATLSVPGNSTQDGAMLGNERDLQLAFSGGGTASLGVSTGTLNFQATGGGAAFASAEAVWDGNDDNASALTFNLLGPLNLTSGADALLIGLNKVAGSPTMQFMVHDGVSSSTVTVFPTASELPQVIRISYSSFSAGANFSSILAIRLTVSGVGNMEVKVDFLRTGSSTAPVFDATLTDVVLNDLDGNGKASPGDTLKYVVRIANASGSDKTAVAFAAPTPANTTLGAIAATPLARADAPAASSTPGTDFHTALNTTLNTTSSGTKLLDNDFPGLPTAPITHFGGGSLGGAVTDNAAGATVNFGAGSLQVNADGGFIFTPDNNFTGLFTFQYRLANSEGTSDATATLAVGVRPAADSDAFDVTGNTQIDTTSIESVLAGDTGDQLAISGNTSPSNGSVSFNNATGLFTYTPNRGYTGGDSFTYTVGNGFGNVIGTVNLTVANRVWYIDVTAAGGGDGRSHTPYNTIGAFNTVNSGGVPNPQVGDIIILRDGNYTEGLTLRNNQRVIGDGWSGSFATAAGFSLALGHSVAGFSDINPTINPTGGAHGVNLASGNHIYGLTAANTSTGFGFRGTSVGNLFIRESSKNGPGGCLDLTQGTGSVDVQFEILTGSSSTAQGVNLVNLAGTLTANSGNITGSSGTAVNITGGTANITIPSSITKNSAGRIVNIQNRTGGTVTLSGTLSQNVSTGTGINVSGCSGGAIVNFSGASKTLNTSANAAVTLASNTGATINFTGGGLDIDTTSGAGFNATGGGTVTVTGTGNTINSGTGGALNIASTTIGANNVTFQSISANGASSGIILNNTGANGLTVTGTDGGDAGTEPDAGTGGTIANTTGNGVSLTSANNISLGGMIISGTGAHGVNVSGGSNLTLVGTQVTNTGNADNEYGLNISNTTGALALNKATFNNAADNLVYVTTTGTLNFTVSNGSSFSYPGSVSATANSAILIEPSGSGAVTASIQNSTFTDIISASAQIGANTLNANGSQSFTFSNNTITSGAGRAGGVVVSGQELTTTTIAINNNNFTGAGGNGVISLDVNDSSTVVGTVNGNIIANPPGIGIFSAVDEAGNSDVTMDGNTIINAGGDGIQTVNFGGSGVSDMRLTLLNNTVNGHNGNAAVAFVGGIAFIGFEDNSCIVLRGNNVLGTSSLPGTRCGGAPCVDYYLEEVGGSTQLEEIPNTAATTASAAYVQSINSPSNASVTVFGFIDLTNGALCPAP
jgi:hypothetical protein